MGKDHTLWAKIDGRVKVHIQVVIAFLTQREKKFSRIRLPKPRRFVSVVPHERTAEAFPLLRLPKVPPKYDSFYDVSFSFPKLIISTRLSPPSKRERKRIAYEARQAPREAPVMVAPLLADTARAALSAEAETAKKAQPGEVHA